MSKTSRLETLASALFDAQPDGEQIAELLKYVAEEFEHVEVCPHCAAMVNCLIHLDIPGSQANRNPQCTRCMWIEGALAGVFVCSQKEGWARVRQRIRHSDKSAKGGSKKGALQREAVAQLEAEFKKRELSGREALFALAGKTDWWETQTIDGRSVSMAEEGQDDGKWKLTLDLDGGDTIEIKESRLKKVRVGRSG